MPFTESDLIKAIVAGQIVNLNGAAVGWFNNPQLGIFANGQMVVVEGNLLYNDAIKVGLANQNLILDTLIEAPKDN